MWGILGEGEEEEERLWGLLLGVNCEWGWLVLGYIKKS